MGSLRLGGLALVVLAVLAGFWAGWRPTTENAAEAAKAWAAGWDELGECAGTSSLDGKLWLELQSDGKAEISGDATKAGRWTLRDGRYHVTFEGETVPYNRVEVDGIVCMLVRGDAGAADLRGSWFSTVTVEPAPGRDDY